MVGKRGASSEGQRQMKDVRRLHGLEQGMSERFLPTPKHRFLGGQRLGLPTTEFFGCLLGVQSDPDTPQ